MDARIAEDCGGPTACGDEDGDGFRPCPTSGDTSGTCDCAEGNAAVYPGAADPCRDGIDTDCDGQDDLCDQDCDGYPTGLAVTVFEDCFDLADVAQRAASAAVHPNGALASIMRRADGDRIARGCAGTVATAASVDACLASLGDGVDQDCNGFIDDGVGCEDSFDRDRDGSRVCMAGATTGCDLNDCDPGIRVGAAEVCGNTLDEDGDGVVAACAPGDNDNDGHVAVAAGGDDCNDTDPHVYLGAPENCATLTVSESCSTNTACGAADADGDGYRDEVDCAPTDSSVHPWAVEVECNGVDDDCDGTPDELLLAPGDPMPRGCVNFAGRSVVVRFTDTASYADTSFCGGCGITTAPNEDCCGSVLTDVSLPTRCGDCTTHCGSHGACERARDGSGVELPARPDFGNVYLCGCEANWGNCDLTLANGCEVDLLTDEANCGMCGNVCRVNQSCMRGACVCDPSFADCNGVAADGCEATTPCT